MPLQFTYEKIHKSFTKANNGPNILEEQICKVL